MSQLSGFFTNTVPGNSLFRLSCQFENTTCLALGVSSRLRRMDFIKQSIYSDQPGNEQPELYMEMECSKRKAHLCAVLAIHVDPLDPLPLCMFNMSQPLQRVAL